MDTWAIARIFVELLIFEVSSYAVRQLSIDVGIPTKLEKLKEEDLPFLCESAAADACAPGNPKHATLEDFEKMFRKLM